MQKEPIKESLEDLIRSLLRKRCSITIAYESNCTLVILVKGGLSQRLSCNSAESVKWAIKNFLEKQCQ